MVDVINSTLDRSVNFVDDFPTIGFFESRYVRRGDGYFIVYLSVQSGCDQACRMCHLTATGQNQFVNATVSDLIQQARHVLNLYQHKIDNNIEVPAKHVHFNFMARGEPLNHPIFKNKEQAYILLSELRKMAELLNLNARFLISTILPQSFIDYELTDIFGPIHPYIYYSIYSLNPKFRKRWLNRAMSPENALSKLSNWSKISEHSPKIHYSFIKGENDSEKDVLDICQLLKKYDLHYDFNIVRYNSYSEKYGEETDEHVIYRNADIIRNELNNYVKIIPRVGQDVKASCGMFVEN